MVYPWFFFTFCVITINTSSNSCVFSVSVQLPEVNNIQSVKLFCRILCVNSRNLKTRKLRKSTLCSSFDIIQSKRDMRLNCFLFHRIHISIFLLIFNKISSPFRLQKYPCISDSVLPLSSCHRRWTHGALAWRLRSRLVPFLNRIEGDKGPP